MGKECAICGNDIEDAEYHDSERMCNECFDRING
jgi:hypothetical protein